MYKGWNRKRKKCRFTSSKLIAKIWGEGHDGEDSATKNIKGQFTE